MNFRTCNILLSIITLGEMLSLRWSNIDLDKAEIPVNTNVIYTKDYEGKSNTKNVMVVQDSPKTKSSIRTVPLTQRSLALLKDFKQKASSIIVFATSTGNYLNPEMWSGHLLGMLQRQELKIVTFIL